MVGQVETQQYLASKLTLVDVKLDSSPKKVDLPFPAHVIYLYSYTDVDPGYVYIAKSQEEKPIRLAQVIKTTLGTPTDELYVTFDPQAIAGPNPRITLLIGRNVAVDEDTRPPGASTSPVTISGYIKPSLDPTIYGYGFTQYSLYCDPACAYPPTTQPTGEILWAWGPEDDQARQKETDIFKVYVLLYASPVLRNVVARAMLVGAGYVYISTFFADYYYRYYISLVKTPDFRNFVQVSDEVLAMDLLTGQRDKEDWYTVHSHPFGSKPHAVEGVVGAVTTLYPGEHLLLRIRGTAWCKPYEETIPPIGIGLNTATLKVHATLFF
jgi:hypothetical protein